MNGERGFIAKNVRSRPTGKKNLHGRALNSKRVIYAVLRPKVALSNLVRINYLRGEPKIKKLISSVNEILQPREVSSSSQRSFHVSQATEGTLKYLTRRSEDRASNRFPRLKVAGHPF